MSKHSHSGHHKPQLPPTATPASATNPGITLDKLLTDSSTLLHVHSVDVKRLRDDRSPIVAGEEVMFVAVLKARLVSPPSPLLNQVELGDQDDIFEIRDDADLVSPLEVVSDEAVTQTLMTAFDFKFVFKINGKTVTRAPVPGDPPWVFRFDTSTYPTDYLKVEVDIQHGDPTPSIPEAVDAEHKFVIWESGPTPADAPPFAMYLVADAHEAAMGEDYTLTLTGAKGNLNLKVAFRNDKT